MKKQLELAPIKKVFSIINSCTNINQVQTCKKLVESYTQLAKEKGVVNFKDIKKTLNIKIKEKETELEYIENFC